MRSLFFLITPLIILLSTHSSFAQKEDLFPMKKMDKWGFINKKGEWVIKPQFEQVKYFSEGLAPATNGKLWGYINEKGEWQIKPQFGSSFSGHTENQWGKRIYDDAADPFYSGLAAVIKRDLAYINKKGEVVIDRDEMDSGYRFSDGLARVEVNRDWGYIDKKGETVIDFKYEDAGTFNEGLAPVKKDFNEWIFINEKGEKVIGPEYEEARSFAMGKAPVKLDWDWFYIYKNGERAFGNKIYEDAHPFSDGVAVVKNQKGDYEVINEKGETIIPSSKMEDLLYVSDFRNGLSLVVFKGIKDEGWSSSGSGDFKIWRNGFYGYINKNGEFIYKQGKEDIAFVKHKTDSVKRVKELRRKRREARLDSIEQAKLKDCPEDYTYGDESFSNYIEINLQNIKRRFNFNEGMLVVKNQGRIYYHFHFPPFGSSDDEFERALASTKDKMTGVQQQGMSLFGGLFKSFFSNMMSRVVIRSKEFKGNYNSDFADETKLIGPDCMVQLRKKYFKNLMDDADNYDTTHVEILKGTKENPEKIALYFKFTSQKFEGNYMEGKMVTSTIYHEKDWETQGSAVQKHNIDSIPLKKVDMEYYIEKRKLRYRPQGQLNFEHVPLPPEGEHLSMKKTSHSIEVFEFKKLSENEIFLNEYRFPINEKKGEQTWLQPKIKGKKTPEDFELKPKNIRRQFYSKRVILFPLKPQVFKSPVPIPTDDKEKRPAYFPIGLEDLPEEMNEGLDKPQTFDWYFVKKDFKDDAFRYSIEKSELDGKRCMKLTYQNREDIDIPKLIELWKIETKRKLSDKAWESLKLYGQFYAKYKATGKKPGKKEEKEVVSKIASIYLEKPADNLSEEDLKKAMKQFNADCPNRLMERAFNTFYFEKMKDKIAPLEELMEITEKHIDLYRRNKKPENPEQFVKEFRATTEKLGFTSPQTKDPEVLFEAVEDSMKEKYNSKRLLDLVYRKMANQYKQIAPLTVWIDRKSALPLKTEFKYKSKKVEIDYRGNMVKLISTNKEQEKETMELDLPEKIMDLYQLEPSLSWVNLKKGDNTSMYYMGINGDIDYIRTNAGKRKRQLYFQPHFVKAEINYLKDTTILFGRRTKTLHPQKREKGMKAPENAIKEKKKVILKEGEKIKAKHYRVTFFTSLKPLPGGYFRDLKINPENGAGYRDYYLNEEGELIRVENKKNRYAERFSIEN